MKENFAEKKEGDSPLEKVLTVSETASGKEFKKPRRESQYVKWMFRLTKSKVEKLLTLLTCLRGLGGVYLPRRKGRRKWTTPLSRLSSYEKNVQIQFASEIRCLFPGTPLP